MRFVTDILAKANLVVDGSVTLTTTPNASVDTDRFLVQDGTVVKYRTGAQILSDIGAQGALTLTTTGTSGPATLVGNTLNIPQYQAVLTNPVTGTGITNYVARWTSTSAIGTGILYDNGSVVCVNATSPEYTEKFRVVGGVTFQHAYTQNNALERVGTVSGLTTTTAGGAAYYPGIAYTSIAGYHQNIFNGSVTIPNSVNIGGISSTASLQFNAASVSVSLTQGGSFRAYAAYDGVIAFLSAQTGGSVSHAAVFHAKAPYYIGSNTPTITNYYGLLLNDSTEYSAYVTVTNRWGVYQAGSSDNNHFNGRVLIGTTTDAGFLLNVNGDALINGVRVGRGNYNYLLNVAVGYNALNANLSGAQVTAIGAGALQSNTTGSYNTALGYNSLYTNTSGQYNTGLGFYALNSNSSGSNNTAIGRSALESNTGSENTAVGSETSKFNTTGTRNTAVGNGANAYISTGSNNTALGYQAGRDPVNIGQFNQTPSNSLYLGYQTRAGGNGNNTNEVVIGASTDGNGSNTVTIGNTSITNTYLRGQLNIATINNATTDTDRFLVSDSGVVKYRTGAEVLSDIGGASSSSISGTTNYIPKFTSSSAIGNSVIHESSGGNIGIGNTNNTYKLDVNGQFRAVAGDYHLLQVVDGSAQLKLERTNSSTGSMYLGADNVGFKVFDGSFNTRLTLTSDGNLGLGVTPFSWNSSWRVLEIGASGAIAYSGAGANDFSYTLNAYYDSGDARWEYRYTGDGATRYSLTALTSEHRWFNAPVGTANAAITWTQAMTLKSTGQLQLNLYTSSSSFTGTAAGVLAFDSSGNIITQSATLYPSGSGTTNYVTKWTGANTLGNGIIYDNGTNVGIGLTTASTKLMIETSGTSFTAPSINDLPCIYLRNSNSANTNAHSILTLRTNNSGGGNPFISFDIENVLGYAMGIDNADADKFKINYGWNSLSSNTRFTIDTSGNIGIGTSAPAYKLQVSGDISTTGAVNQYIRATGFISNQIGQLSDFGASDAGFYVLATGGLQFVGGGANRVILTSGGNVGIGTTSPSASDWNANSRLLHIYQNTTDGSILKLESSNTSGVLAVGNDQFQIGTSTNDPVRFYTNSTERMIITSGGEVYIDAIGTSGADLKDGAFLYRNNSGSYLQFSSGINPDNPLFYFYRKNAGNTGVDAVGNIAYVGTSLVLNGGSQSNQLVLNSSGNVGVGTTSVPFGLSVYRGSISQGDTSTNLLLFDTTPYATGVGGGISFGGYYDSSNSEIYTYGYVKGGKENSTDGNFAGYLSFGTRAQSAGSSAERMRITSVGQIRLAQYTSTSSFPGTAAGFIGFDSSGNLITVASAGGVSGSGTTNYVARWTASTTLGIGVLYDNGTNVGIGTTSPSYTLQVGKQTAGDNTDYAIAVSRHGTGASPGTWTGNPAITIQDQTDGGPASVDVNGLFNISLGRFDYTDTNAANATLLSFTYDGQLGPMRVDGKGNTWIGYDRGAAPINSGAFNLLVRNGISVGSSYQSTTPPSDGAIIQGNVLIGTTTNVGARLFVVGSTDIINATSTSTNARINIGHSANGGYIGYSNTGATGNLFYVTTGSGTIGSGITMDNNGNVGIGTTNPTSLLHLNGSGGDGAPILRIVGSASDTFNWASSTMYANLTAGENAIHLIGKAQSQYNSGYFGFRQVADNSSSNMITLGLYAADNLVNILGNGNVGIGTIAPTRALHVVGVIRTQSGEVLVNTNQGGIGWVTIEPTSATNGQIALNVVNSSGTSFASIRGNGDAYFNGFVNTGQQGLNVAGYAYLSQTISGAMTILGHNVRASDSVANQVNVVNGGWYSSMIKMYYTEGITFHSSNTSYAAGATFYQSGGTTNELMRITNGGNVGIGSTSPDGRLYVERTATWSSGNLLGTNTVQYITYGSGASPGTVAISAVGAFQQATFTGSATIGNGGRHGAIDSILTVGNTSSGTITLTQSSTIRALSTISAATYYNPSAATTITHLAGIRVLPDINTGAGAITVNNKYGILIGDASGGSGSITYTTRWGIYQEGASDNNYFAAKVLIGTTTATSDALYVNGTAYINGNMTVNGTVTELSSVNYKRNINTLENTLEKVDKMRAVSYNRVGGVKKEIGLIAEEVEQVYPEFVEYDNNGRPMGLNYARLTAVLLQSIKELNGRINELENRN